MMRKLTVITAIVFAFCLTIGNGIADTAEFQLSVVQNDMTVGGNFRADLQIRNTSGVSPKTLNSMTIYIYYSAALTPAATYASNWAFGSSQGYSRSCDSYAGNFIILVTGNAVNEDNNTDPDSGNPPGWDVTDSWKTVVRLNWTIVSATTVNVTIDDGTDAAAYFQNHTNAPPSDAIDWTVSNTDLGDVSLPVQMTNFTAQTTSREGVILNWTTESETNSAGFHIWRGESENAIDLRVTSALIPSHGNSSSRNDYTFTDRDAHGKTFWYKIEEVSLAGQSQFLGPITVEAALPLPEHFSVSRNYPNPFNPETKLQYDLPEDGAVSVRVFDLMGREVKTLADGQMSAGRYEAVWDGTNQLGNAVSSGIYFIRVQAGEFSAVRKMTLMR